jgi:hypothetical protein
VNSSLPSSLLPILEGKQQETFISFLPSVVVVVVLVLVLLPLRLLTLLSLPFCSRLLTRLRPFLVAKGEQLKARIERFAKTGEAFDLQQTFQRYTFDVIGFVAFGIDFDYLIQDSSPFELAFNYVLEHLMSRFVCPFQNYWEYISTPATKKYDKVRLFKKKRVFPGNTCHLALCTF